MQSIFSQGASSSRSYLSYTNRYPALAFIATLYQAFAVFFLVIYLLGAFGYLFVSDADGITTVIISVVLLLGGGVIFLLLWSSAEIIKLSIHIEENTRRSADILESQAQLQKK